MVRYFLILLFSLNANATLTIPFLNTGINKIQNGDMRLDQRNEGASASLGTTVVVDRWLAGKANTTATATIQRVTSSLPPGFTHAQKVSLTGTDASLGATDYIYVEQIIEGSTVGDLKYGTADAAYTTLSFWVNSSGTGTYCVFLSNSANNRNYVAEYSIASSNTWEKKAIVISGDTTGTWQSGDGTVGLAVGFTLMAGSTQQQTAGSWTANSSRYGSANQVNWAANASATFLFTGVQLEKGTYPTDFEWDEIGVAYVKAQRFYEKTYNRGVAVATNTGTGTRSLIGITAATTTTYIGTTQFMQPKYAAPTVTIYSNAGTSAKLTRMDTDADAGTSAAAQTIGVNGFRYIGVTSGIAGTGHSFHFTADTGF